MSRYLSRELTLASWRRAPDVGMRHCLPVGLLTQEAPIRRREDHEPAVVPAWRLGKGQVGKQDAPVRRLVRSCDGLACPTLCSVVDPAVDGCDTKEQVFMTPDGAGSGQSRRCPPAICSSLCGVAQGHIAVRLADERNERRRPKCPISAIRACTSR